MQIAPGPKPGNLKKLHTGRKARGAGDLGAK
jgi:hypothetical protein